jgi:hypothetical protein
LLSSDPWQPAGDVTDHGWYRNVTFENGKPHCQAVAILSRIFYMYRPVREEIRDPETGLFEKIIMKQKFAADLWQISRQALADMFGFSVREIDSSLDTLKRHDLIWTELRTLMINGNRVSNVMYIGLNLLKLKEISTPITFERNSYSNEKDNLSHPDVRPRAVKCKTNTKTSRKTSQKPTTSLSPPATQDNNSSSVDCITKIPSEILSLIPNSKKKEHHLETVALAVAISGKETVRYNILRALEKSTEDDPWGHVMSMLRDLSNGYDWYSSVREKEAGRAKKVEDKTEKLRLEGEEADRRRQAEEAENRKVDSWFGRAEESMQKWIFEEAECRAKKDAGAGELLLCGDQLRSYVRAVCQDIINRRLIAMKKAA